MKSKVFFRHVKDSLRSLRRNGWMSVAAVSAVTVTLLLVGIFMALIFNLRHISQQVENDVQVRVYIDKKTTTKQRDDLKDKLKKLDHVNKVTYRSRQQELDTIIGGYGSQWRMFSGDQNPLSDVFMVKTNSPKATISVSKEAQKLDHVVDASYGGRTAKKLFNSVDVAQKWGLAFTILLLFVAVFLINNTIRITILSRSDEIRIMRLVGATNSYIRWPFLLEGAWTGLFGAVLPIIIVDVGYAIVYRSFTYANGASGYTLYANMPFLFWLDLMLAGIGIVIGALGSVISMRRFLKF